MASPLSVSAWVQPDRRVLQEALPDWLVAEGTGAGSPGRAGPETPSLVHSEDSNGQTLSGCTLCHQGRRNRCLHGKRNRSREKLVMSTQQKFFHCDSCKHIHTGIWLFKAAASSHEGVLMGAGKGLDQIKVCNLPSAKQCQILPTTTQEQSTVVRTKSESNPNVCNQEIKWLH